ncbi:unnamed protein product [Gongylonema pulchrum]|uniref:Solute carrier family 25 member 51 n=1 Tax=Gongylonema pulchrum TaxID=637853 RepID=A0A183DV55_9BILA|nr:unnamed protein product [Gongylonema pulchrum]
MAGWGAGLVETLLLYPQNKVIFRQQLHGITAIQVFRQLRSEGCWLLYRGVLPPLIQRTTTRSVMFGMFDKLHHLFGCSECTSSTARLSCYAYAAFMGKTITSFQLKTGTMEALLCPLERTQVLLQIPEYNHRYQNTAHAFGELAKLRSEGCWLLYRGVLPPLIQRTTTRSVMFGMFDKLHHLFGCSERTSSAARLSCYAYAAFMAGTMEALLCPLERTQVLLQIPEYNHRYQNTAHAFGELAKIGLKELYRGFTVILWRNGLSNVLFFTLRKPLREIIVSNEDSMSSVNQRLPNQLMVFVGNFISGALLGAFISTLFFPVNVVKQRIQSTVNTPHVSARVMFRIIWQERNGSMKELFRGATLNYTR